MVSPCAKMPKTFTMICLYLAFFNLAIMMPITLLIILPISYHSGVMRSVVIDSEEKFNSSGFGMPIEIAYDHCFFNLTNGRDLLTLSPVPKPAFQEVCVRAVMKGQNFDFELNSDGSEATFKSWSTIDLRNVYDWNLEIVTINPNLMALIGAFGSETTVASLQPALYEALKADAAIVKPDGTGALNAGIFVRHTIREIIRGYITPITNQSALPAMISNVYLGYRSVDELRAAIAAGSAVGMAGAPGDGGRHFSKTIKTGKARAEEIGRLAALKGHRSFTTVTPLDSLWLFTDPGWDISGDMSAGHETFVLENLRLVSGQAPLAVSDYPYLAAAGLSPIGQLPSFGKSVTMLDEVMLRTFTYECDNGCAGQRIHNALAVQKYSLSDVTWQLAVAGIVDDTGLCALSVAGCDYGMREPHGFVAGGQMHTLPYFGNSSRRSHVSMQPYGGGDELAYKVSDMGKGISLWFEPFSGALIQSESNLQQNTIVPKAIFDGSLYSNVFGSSSPFDPVFIWPDTRKHIRIEVDRAVAQDIAKIGPNLLYMLILIGVIVYVVTSLDSLRQSFLCWQKVREMRRLKPDAMTVERVAGNIATPKKM